MIEAIVHAAQDLDVADASVGMNHGIKDYSARDILAHELHWIRGIDFAGCDGLSEIRRGGTCVVPIGFVIELSKADYPTAAGRVQVWHVQRDGIEPAIAENCAFGLREIAGVGGLHGAWSAAHAGWANAGQQVGIDCICRLRWPGVAGSRGSLLRCISDIKSGWEIARSFAG